MTDELYHKRFVHIEVKSEVLSLKDLLTKLNTPPSDITSEDYEPENFEEVWFCSVCSLVCHAGPKGHKCPGPPPVPAHHLHGTQQTRRREHSGVAQSGTQQAHREHADYECNANSTHLQGPSARHN